MISLAVLAVFSGLSLNLLLSFALGAAGVATDLSDAGTKRQLPLLQLGLMFVSVLFLWVFFTFMIPFSWRGFSEYFLFFPFSALVCMGLEFIIKQFFCKKTGGNGHIPDMHKMYSAYTAYDGLVPASLLITFALAERFAAAMVLSFFFVLGNLVAIIILDEIRRRSTLEWVPHYLRGTPLILISMGLLSLVCGAAAGICFRILEIF